MTTTPKTQTIGDFFVNLVVGYRSAKAVQVAHELGVFARLDGSEKSPQTLAAELSTAAHPTKLLLRALAAMGLLTVKEGRFANTPMASAHLVPGKPGYMGANLAYQELLWGGWSSLRQIVETGQPPGELAQRLFDPKFTFDYLSSVNNLSKSSAAVLATHFKAAPPTALLDVGSGLGTYSATLCKEFSELKATLLDLPPTLALAKAELGAQPFASRLTFREGNYHEADFGGPFDLVLFSHVTHDESYADNVLLLRKACKALRPGGKVVIHDFVVQDDGAGPLFEALFSVNMLMYSKGGQVFSVADYKAMLGEAGLETVSVFSLQPELPHGTRAVIGQKPA